MYEKAKHLYRELQHNIQRYIHAYLSEDQATLSTTILRLQCFQSQLYSIDLLLANMHTLLALINPMLQYIYEDNISDTCEKMYVNIW